jgi:hypothetical protein
MTVDVLNEQCNEYKMKAPKQFFFVWTPAMQFLKIVYFQQNWGWHMPIRSNSEWWVTEQHREQPRKELFPSIYYKKQTKSKNPLDAPDPAQQIPTPTHQTPEQTRNNWINQLLNNPDNTLARDILVRNYHMSRQDINDIIARTSDCLAVNQ